MNRQDRQGARTPADLERKYKFGKSFSEVMGAANDARVCAQNAENAVKKFSKVLYDPKSGLIARLDMKLDTDKLVSQFNLAANEVTINSDHFKLSADGKITSTGGKIALWDISEKSISKYTDTTLVQLSAPEADSADVLTVATIKNGAVTDVPFYLKANGKIKATLGEIAGFDITPTQGIRKISAYSEIQANGATHYGIIFKPQNIGSGSGVLAIGDLQRYSADDNGKYYMKNFASFYVDGKGYLQAKNANISGTMMSGTETLGNKLSNGIITNFDDSYVSFLRGQRLQFQYTASDGLSDSRYIYRDANYLRFGGAVRFDSSSDPYGGSVDFYGKVYHHAQEYFYATVYNSAASAVFTSDRNLKNTISIFTDKHDVLFDSLIPSTYKYNNGTSGRTHFGFIAQPTVEAIEAAGLTLQDCALACQFELDGQKVWGLRYDEFVSLNTWQIQKLKARVAKLEKLIKENISNE